MDSYSVFVVPAPARVVEKLHPRRRRHELRRLADVPAGPQDARRRLEVSSRRSQLELVVGWTDRGARELTGGKIVQPGLSFSKQEWVVSLHAKYFV